MLSSLVYQTLLPPRKVLPHVQGPLQLHQAAAGVPFEFDQLAFSMIGVINFLHRSLLSAEAAALAGRAVVAAAGGAVVRVEAVENGGLAGS